MKNSPVTDQELAELAAGFRGELFRPGDQDYDTRRELWNAMVARRPALIARVRGSSDIKAAIGFARRTERAIAVRCGGHSAAGNGSCNDGVMIDMSLMRGVRVDAARRTARVEGGAMWGDVDRETQEFGLATPSGVVSTTGVGGLTLGGGMGWLTRRFGFSCENVLSMDLITADGEQLVCSEESNSDLFWALRGGGGNFGVVTSFEFRLHPVGPMVVGGMIGWGLDDAQDMMEFFGENGPDLPNELGMQATIVGMRSAPFVPEHLWDTRVLAFIFCWSGDPDDSDEVLRPILEHRKPAFEGFDRHSFVDQQSMLDPWSQFGRHMYYKSGSLRQITGNVAATALQCAATAPSLESFAEFYLMGSNRGAGPETAYDNSGFPWIVNVVASWVGPTPEDDAHVAWAKDTLAAVNSAGESGGVYSNFLNEDEAGRVPAEAFSPETYARLQEIKAIYDPENVFHINHNIAPAATAASSA